MDNINNEIIKLIEYLKERERILLFCKEKLIGMGLINKDDLLLLNCNIQFIKTSLLYFQSFL